MDGAKRYVGGVARHKKEFEDILIGGTINCICFVSVVKNDLVNGVKSHDSPQLHQSMPCLYDVIQVSGHHSFYSKNLLLSSKQFLYKTSLYSNPLLSSKN